MRYSEKICVTFQRCSEIIAKRWTALILRVLMEKPRRFSELAEELEVVSDRILSERLKELEREGIVERRVYPCTPVRVEYSMTEKGRALGPVLDAMESWSSRWIVPDEHTETEEAAAEIEQIGTASH
jgi:DNA-binding HxlR family transcriptional regulator